MKFSLLTILVLALTLSSTIDARNGRRRGGRRGGRRSRFNPIGFGGLGYPGLGLGGLGMGVFGMGGLGMAGFGMGGLSMAGLGMAGLGMATNGVTNTVSAPVANTVQQVGQQNTQQRQNTVPQMRQNTVQQMGKRSEMTLLNKTESTCEITRFEQTSLLNCNGPMHNFECELNSGLKDQHLEMHLVDLRIVPFNNTIVNASVYSLLSFRSEESLFNNMTLIRDNEPVLWTLHNLSEYEGEGFRVQNADCWEKLEDMMTHDEQAELSMKLSY